MQNRFIVSNRNRRSEKTNYQDASGISDRGEEASWGDVCGAKTVKKSFGRERQKRSNDGRDDEEE